MPAFLGRRKRDYRRENQHPSKCGRVGPFRMSRHEAAWLTRRKRELGVAWVHALYRGLGLRREDYLASLREREK